MEKDLATVTAENEELSGALTVEQAKTKALLAEVTALEDEMVNRFLTEFAPVISDATRDFWREQLLNNRDSAKIALAEMARLKQGADGERRPLHNRATARPAPRTGAEGETPAVKDDQAAKIRNRAHEICRLENVAFSVAFRRAEAELPAK